MRRWAAVLMVPIAVLMGLASAAIGLRLVYELIVPA